MKERKRGKIISILTSYTVGRPPNNISPYLVGKYSLLGLSKSLAVELGPYGITINCISPSMTNTPLIEKLPSKLKEITASQIPLGKLAEPKNVASVALFLCSDHADYISGENILVTGAQTMH
jgi:3-oxoacyl-[acyl-carrier protein] reductase